MRKPSKKAQTTSTPVVDSATALYRAEKEARAIRVQQKARKERTTTGPKEVLKALDLRKNGRLSARGLTCLCGCGTNTHTMDARFISGHDAKLRKAVLYDGQELPSIIRPFYEAGEVVAGMKLCENPETGELELVDTKAGAVEEAIARKA